VFTNVDEMEKLKLKLKKNLDIVSKTPSSTAISLTKSRTVKTDWEICLICKKDKLEHLRQVDSMNMNNTIMNLAKCDYYLHIRTSSVVDLMAEEGWQIESGKLKPILVTLEPIPAAHPKVVRTLATRSLHFMTI